jgi:hypothetical protein
MRLACPTDERGPATRLNDARILHEPLLSLLSLAHLR